jgi:hypothetical protein
VRFYKIFLKNEEVIDSVSLAAIRKEISQLSLNELNVLLGEIHQRMNQIL